MTTIKDVAQIAKVSVGTVSNYYNAPELLADETRERIRKAVEALGYYPKAAARSLKSKQTRRIGIIPVIDPSDNKSLEPSDVTFLEFLSAINTVAAENNYAVLMAAALKNSDEMALYQKMVGAGQVDGFILSGVRDRDERLLFLDAQNIPYVAFGRSKAAKGIQVDVDGAVGMEKAVDYLIELGHQRIGFITPPPGLMCTEHRLKGFHRALAKHHLEVTQDYIQPGNFQEKSGQVAMHLLLDLPIPPTAIITANDICAFGAINALKKRGLAPAKDISVIGFDDIRLASHWSPPLTTISQPYRKIGFKTASLLIDAIKGKSVDRECIMMPELVVRNSTASVK